MQPFVQDADFVLYVGDVREVLAGLPDESVHCVVTSPPYWGLRDYGTGSWAGGDPDCDHLAPLATTRGGPNSTLTSVGARDGVNANTTQTHAQQFRETCGKCGAQRVDQQLGLEPTPEQYVANMVGVFREVRRVLRRDGTCWLNIGDSYHGSYIAQSRVDGRPDTLNAANPAMAHKDTRHNLGTLKPKDLVGIPWRLAFALQADGWYLRSEIIWAKPNPMPESVTDRPTKSHEQVFLLTRSPRYFYDADAVREPYQVGWASEFRTGDRYIHTDPQGMDNSRAGARGPDGRRKTSVLGQDGSLQHRDGERWPNPSGRNLRSVWEIATQPYPEAHFATYPEALVERCVKAGSPLGGTILDPFMGSGTTALVARNLGRHSIGVELNETYASLAARRLSQQSLLTEAS